MAAKRLRTVTPDPAPEAVRLDKWLWQARFFRSRAIAAQEVIAGHVRLNGQRVGKPGHVLRLGDTLTFPQGDRIRLIRVTAAGHRRGPATEARRLYLDLDAVPETSPDPLSAACPDAAPRPLEGPTSFD